MRFGHTRLRAAAFAAFLSVFVASTGAVAPVPAATATTATPASRVIALAKAQLGDPWVHYAVGPRAFDCSGLVYYVFRQTGYLSKIGGRRMSGYGYYTYFRNRGLASRSGGRPGDLVIWGGGSHVGIYLGGGLAISTLTRGVRIHGVYAVTARFTAFLHTRMSGTAAPTAPPAAPPAVAPPAVAPPAVAPPAVATKVDTGATANPSTAATPKSAVIRRTKVNLNFRSGPGTDKHRIRTLKRGTTFTVLTSRRDTRGRVWYKVQLTSGARGWVASWYTRR